MKITPLEIRQKTFQKKLRGFDAEEVKSFLDVISREWESLVDEKKHYKIKVQQLEKEVQKLREVEDSLVKTLKTAQDTSAQIEGQAAKSADLTIKEAHIKADNIEKEARWQARNILEKAHNEANNIYKDLQQKTRDLERHYDAVLEYRDDAIDQLQQLGQSSLEKAEKFKKTFKRPSFVTPDYVEADKNIPQPTNHNPDATASNSKNEDASDDGSFFDELNN